MRRLLVLTTLVGFTLSVWSPAEARSLGIPASLYPSGSHISYRPHLTNTQVDCLWGFFCEGYMPLFHSTSQDALHRRGGWGQFAGWHTAGKVMAFELFSSSYAAGTNAAGVSWSEAALEDFVAMLPGQGYISEAAASFPASLHAEVLCSAARSTEGNIDLVVLACRRGDVEVEGIAMAGHASRERGMAVGDLRRQVAAALGRAPN